MNIGDGIGSFFAVNRLLVDTHSIRSVLGFVNGCMSRTGEDSQVEPDAGS